MVIKLTKNVLLLSILVLTSSCASFSIPFFDKKEVKPVVVEKLEIKREKLDLPLPKPLELDNIEFVVITEKNFDEVLKKFSKENKDFVLFGITVDGYKSLSMSIAELRKFIKTQQFIILEYKKYYE